MSARRITATLSLAVAVFAGCAGRPEPRAADTADCHTCEDKQARAPSDERAADLHGSSAGSSGASMGAEARSLSMQEEPAPPAYRASRWDVRRIGADARAGDASGGRPRRTKKVDIDLHAAPFDEVMRLLGDTGKFNVVVEAPSAGDVTIRLRDVEPYDALLVIAEARGIDVDYRRGVVVVGAPIK